MGIHKLKENQQRMMSFIGFDIKQQRKERNALNAEVKSTHK